jgi:hypothetical protein
MNGFLHVGVTSPRLEGGRVIGLSPGPHVELRRIQIGEQRPGQVILQVAPDSCNRVQLRTVRGSAPQTPVRRDPQPLGCVRPAVVEPQEVQTVGEGLGERVEAELEALGIEVGPFQAAPLPGRRGHGASARDPFDDMRHRADGLHPTRGEASSTDRPHATAAFVLAAHAHRARMRGRDDAWQRLAAGRLERPARLRGFWCGAAVGP